MEAMKIRRVQEAEIPDLSAVLKRARGNRPLSQVAKDAQITRQSLRRFEEGEATSIKYSTLIKLEKVLGISLNVTFEDTL